MYRAENMACLKDWLKLVGGRSLVEKLTCDSRLFSQPANSLEKVEVF